MMGLSVAVLFDYRDGDYKVYFDKDVQELSARINSADLAVGFNTVPFDDNLIRGSGGDLKPASEIKSWDILYHSRIAAGWKPNSRFPSGMNLDEHLKATFGHEWVKTANGAEAPKMFKAGQIGALTTYCISDVRREKMLFEHIVKHGWVNTAMNGKKYIDLSLINRAIGQ